MMIDLSKSTSKLTHHVRINSHAWSDILWWYIFLESWNGVSLLSMARNESQISCSLLMLPEAGAVVLIEPTLGFS